mmetsp:Transcript_16725/g.33440  ORF Transcript_16725/g.33440 Transcript_16725/m.33440 type:complete len:121 (-) Transcript_16725:222-584(-)|eukprot:CAMPEP_0178570656 /NCGR_PEP_ID=MMETSP0697-20121206/17196_1 /TAXON_ID=265572 /ORGANISM="Extubocellulus spinifer, Strain CCMP396" /LENGTH=120 /DNA_ID=CAMNT_0020205113 /DNA_START=295 /DNA_END=657 /DNA_ORIENTATION=-
MSSLLPIEEIVETGVEGVEYGVEESMSTWLDEDNVDDVVDMVEPLSSEVRLVYRCLDLKLPQPFLISLLRAGVRQKERLDEDDDDEEQSLDVLVSEMTRVVSDGILQTLDSGLLLLCPAL